jgi:hypothetical protein
MTLTHLIDIIVPLGVAINPRGHVSVAVTRENHGFKAMVKGKSRIYIPVVSVSVCDDGGDSGARIISEHSDFPFCYKFGAKPSLKATNQPCLMAFGLGFAYLFIIFSCQAFDWLRPKTTSKDFSWKFTLPHLPF